MILYRPVDLSDLLLIYRTGMRQIPPRMLGHPALFQVATVQYADEIAKEYYANTGSMAGYTTELAIADSYASSFKPLQIGTEDHLDLWIPADSLDELNGHIVGRITVVTAHFGSAFVGIPSSLRKRGARSQLQALYGIREDCFMDFRKEILRNHEAVFVHFSFWEQIAEQVPESQPVLAAIRDAWRDAFPAVSLGLQPVRTWLRGP